MLSPAGIDAAFAPTDQTTNDAWVVANLEQVLEPKTFVWFWGWAAETQRACGRSARHLVTPDDCGRGR